MAARWAGVTSGRPRISRRIAAATNGSSRAGRLRAAGAPPRRRTAPQPGRARSVPAAGQASLLVLPFRMQLGAVSPAPQELTPAAAALVGRPLSDASIAEAAEIAQHQARPLDNTDFAPHWRKQVVRVYAARAPAELKR